MKESNVKYVVHRREVWYVYYPATKGKLEAGEQIRSLSFWLGDIGE